MTVRPLNLETDLPIVAGWWRGHSAPVVVKEAFLSADGFVAENGEMLAASWLYVAPGTRGGIGVLEFTTTNPIGSPRHLLSAVNALYQHIEEVAWAKGCGSILSFVAQNRSEQHLLAKIGWQDVTGVPHMIFGKSRPCP